MTGTAPYGLWAGPGAQLFRRRGDRGANDNERAGEEPKPMPEQNV